MCWRAFVLLYCFEFQTGWQPSAFIQFSFQKVSFSFCCFLWQTERRQRSSLLFGGRNPAIYYQDDLKKRMNKMMTTWWNGCLDKMDCHPFNTIPNHHLTKMDVLTKTFVRIILAQKWLLRHTKYVPQTAATTFAFSSVFILLLWAMHIGYEPWQHYAFWVYKSNIFLYRSIQRKISFFYSLFSFDFF